jgi:hypothetical protein
MGKIYSVVVPQSARDNDLGLIYFMPEEVALSCNLSYWEARIGDGYELGWSRNYESS